MAIMALFAVTTCLPADKAALVRAKAGPSEPPMSSTTTSTSSRVAKSTGLSHHAQLDMSKPRSLPRERADTAVKVRVLPAAIDKSVFLESNKEAVCAPTTPRPAIAMRHSDMTNRPYLMLINSLHQKARLHHKPSPCD